MDGSQGTVAIATPKDDADIIDWLRLIRSRRVGPGTFMRLMCEHGDARTALAELPKVAGAAGVEDYEPCPEGLAVAELKAGRMAGARLLFVGSPEYPAALTDLTDAPPLLWALGQTDLLARPAIGIVGARNASSLGLRMARKLAGDLGRRGEVVVSGLARGLDAAAHEGAIDTGTIAVMPGGVDVVYPKENAVLAQQIQDKGLRLSENPPGALPQARHFAQRNRLISGLARALVVIEAAAKSGSLITARAALDQGREVLAVPGHPFDARASGCNMLIRDGATLIRSADDVMEALDGGQGPAEALPLPIPTPAGRAEDNDQQLRHQIIGTLRLGPITEDQLIRDLNLPAAIVSPSVSRLEIDGRLSRRPGGVLATP